MADDERESPLHHAARRGHTEIAELLIEHKAPLEAINLVCIGYMHAHAHKTSTCRYAHAHAHMDI